MNKDATLVALCTIIISILTKTNALNAKEKQFLTIKQEDALLVHLFAQFATIIKQITMPWNAKNAQEVI